MLGVRYRHSAIHIRMEYMRGNSCGIHIRNLIHNNAYMENNKQWDTHNGVQHTMEYNTQQHNGVQYATYRVLLISFLF
jgi:hypothetical protein